MKLYYFTLVIFGITCEVNHIDVFMLLTVKFFVNVDKFLFYRAMHFSAKCGIETA